MAYYRYYSVKVIQDCTFRSGEAVGQPRFAMNVNAVHSNQKKVILYRSGVVELMLMLAAA